MRIDDGKYENHSHDVQSYNGSRERNENHKDCSFFKIIFHKFFQKLTRKCNKIFIKILKNLYEVFLTFLKIFRTISLKFQKNIFDISLYFHNIKNIKLRTCFLIFSKLILYLLRNFSTNFGNSYKIS